MNAASFVAGRNRRALVRLCAFFVPWVPELCSERLAAPGEDIGASVRSSRGLPRPAARPAAFPTAGPAGTAELTPENSKHALALRITGRPPPLPHAPEGADPRVRPLHTALSPGGKGGAPRCRCCCGRRGAGRGCARKNGCSDNAKYLTSS